jgi:hypothetical protein
VKAAYILPALAVVTSFVPVVYGAVRLSGWSPGTRALWRWLAFGAAANLAMMVMGLRGQKNLELSLYIILFLGVLGFEALGKLSGSTRVLAWYRLGASACAGVWLASMVYLEHGGDFDIYVGPALYLGLTLAAAFLVVTRVRIGVPSILQDPAVLAAFATMVVYTPFAVLGPVASSAYQTNPVLFLQLFGIRATCETIGALLYFLALKWTPRTHS